MTAGRRFASSSARRNFRARGALTAAGAVLGAGVVSHVVFADNKVDYDKLRKDIANILDDEKHDDGSLGPIFVRLAWHLAGTYDKNTKTGGSNGGTIRFQPEAGYGANAGLGLAMARLEKIKQAYPGVSYADLYTLAGVVAVEEMGGPRVPWRPGRTDAASGAACTADGRLPDASKKEQHIRDIFYRMGFNDQEIVALVGAHSMGRCHKDRSGYLGPWTRAPTTFSNLFFKELTENKWTPKQWNGPLQYQDPTGELMMLPADLALLSDPAFRKWVDVYAKDEARFRNDFAKAFSKLLELGVPFKGCGSCCDKDKTFYAAAVAAGVLGLLAVSQLRKGGDKRE